MMPTPVVEKTPFEYFKLFASDKVLNSITEQTNIYILQSKGAEKSILKKDIEKFIDIFLRMGLVRLPSLKSYWETFMTYDGVSTVRGRKKFETILRNIHFVNNLEIAEEEKANNRVWKLRTWITELPQNFQFGGAFYDFDIYQGKSKSNSDTSLDISADVVVNLTSLLPDKHNFKVFADNYFTSLALIVELRKCNIFFVGRIRGSQMKKCPLLSEKDLKKQGRGAFDF